MIGDKTVQQPRMVVPHALWRLLLSLAALPAAGAHSLKYTTARNPEYTSSAAAPSLRRAERCCRLAARLRLSIEMHEMNMPQVRSCVLNA